ncbi:hypothetical protein DRP07_11505 [Archaeoglobales archaeon]|nr:MAG: hypothetical protein DRP07_11505 [Archaeoglobales archaeon]
MELLIAKKKDKDIWDKAVLKSERGTIFHTWDWLEILEESSGLRLYYLLLFDGDELFGIFPIFEGKKYFLKYGYSPPPGFEMTYLGPLFIRYMNLKQNKKEEKILKATREFDSFFFSEQKYNYVDFGTVPGFEEIKPILWRGYKARPKFTYNLSLDKSLDKLWCGLSRSAKKEIKKAKKNGIKMRTGDWKELKFIQKRRIERSREIGRSVPKLKDYFKKLFDCFFPEKLKIFVAEDDCGKLISGSIILIFKDKGYGWVGLHKGNDTYTNTFLLWEVICWSKRKGLSSFEIMDAGNALRTCRFKSKFNPQTYTWFNISKYLSNRSKLVRNILKY